MKRLFAAVVTACIATGPLAVVAAVSPPPVRRSGTAAIEETQAGPSQSKRAAKTPSVAKASLLDPASMNAKAPDAYRVKFTTTKGVFVVQVTRAWSPLGADRFYNLVKNGFYDGASFFRVLPGFVAQFGINAKPEVSRVWQAATIKDDPVVQSNHRGYLTFATGGPNTRTTQVFINLADNARLDGMGFSAFGEVTEGMDVVDKFYSGYGEGPPRGRGPDQGRIQTEGKTYLDKDFPQLDSVKTAVVLPHSSAAHSSAPPKRNQGKEKD
jgi:peptidyl-prolyl cis-trans isomerase A (cyclophilin A)